MINAAVAQRTRYAKPEVERRICNAGIAGSSPVSGFLCGGTK